MEKVIKEFIVFNGNDDLTPIKNHFMGDLILTEKGLYVYYDKKDYIIYDKETDKIAYLLNPEKYEKWKGAKVEA